MKNVGKVAIALFFLSSTCALAQDLPKGSMIAWMPPTDAIDTASNSVKFPRGWKACEIGATGDPMFLGAVSPESYLGSMPDSLKGGVATHTHSVTISATATIENDIDKGPHKNAAGAGHVHPATASEASNLPPFMKVVLICKQ